MSHTYYNRRGRGSQTPNYSAQSSRTIGGRDPLKDLIEKPSATLEKPRIDSSDKRTISVKDLQYLGSYNWTEAKEPTVIVPGSPPVWKSLSLPFRVQPDSGDSFIDQNAYRIGETVLLPLIQSVETINEHERKPSFDWSSVDFVTDRNGLRKLLRWVTAPAHKPPQDFRIDTQLAGDKTVLFNRWEEKNKEDGNQQFRSYGHSFETKVTDVVGGCEASTGHHRIVTYDFDGLKMVVRFEVDACLPSGPTAASFANSSGDDELAEMVSKLKIGSAVKSTPELKIVWGGREVGQTSIVEMKTRSEKSIANFDWEDTYPQLYLSQTKHLYIGVHQTGTFVELRKEDASSNGSLGRVAKNAQPGFKLLRKALESIQTLVKLHGTEGRISLVCKGGVLRVYERSSGDSCLPDRLMALFERKN